MRAGTDPDWLFLALGALALALAIISGLRLIQRASARRYLSVGAFAVRLAISLWLVWVIGSVLMAD